MKINETDEFTPAMLRAMKREEFWAQQRNLSTTERGINHARKMEKMAAAAYASACKKQKK